MGHHRRRRGVVLGAELARGHEEGHLEGRDGRALAGPRARLDVERAARLLAERQGLVGGDGGQAAGPAQVLQEVDVSPGKERETELRHITL